MPTPGSPELLLMLDFDGVIVDSYSGLENVFRHLMEDIPPLQAAGATVEKMLLLEDLMDFLGTRDRKNVYKAAFGLSDPLATLVVERYWEERMRRTVLLERNLESLVKRLSKSGVEVRIVCSQDDTVERKRQRVEKALGPWALDHLVIYGPHSEHHTVAEAVEHLLGQHSPKLAAYLDDKSMNLGTLRHLQRRGLVLLRRDFKPPFPQATAWNMPLPPGAKSVKDLGEALDLLRGLLGSIF